jgi:hypothetical protein
VIDARGILGLLACLSIIPQDKAMVLLVEAQEGRDLVLEHDAGAECFGVPLKCRRQISGSQAEVRKLQRFHCCPPELVEAWSTRPINLADGSPM